MLLTAQRFLNERVAERLSAIIEERKRGGEYGAAFITTAADAKDKDLYNIKDRDRLLQMGCTDVVLRHGATLF